MKKLLTTLLFFALLLPFLHAQEVMNMTLLGQWDPDTLPTSGGREYNDIWGYTDCDGREYAIMGSAGMVHFIDINEPSEPVEIARFPGGQTTTWRDIKVYRDRAYAVSDATQEGLMIFDMSQLPDTVIKTYQSNEYFNRAHNIFMDNGKLYCVGTDTEGQGMIVLDLTEDPDNPTLLSSVFLPGGGYIHDVYVQNDTAYCSHGFNGFYIWDFSDPSQPVELASISTNGYNHSSWLLPGGQYAIYAEEVPTGLPLGIADLTDLDVGDIETALTFKFPLLAPTYTNNTPHNPFLRGDYAIISYYEDGVQIFDLSDPLDPKQVAYYDTHANAQYNGYNGCWGVYPFFPSGIIAASDINGGLFLLQADSIDWEPVEPVLFPELEVSVETELGCFGEPVEVLVSSSSEEVQLLVGDTSLPAPESFFLESPTTFSVEATNKHCTLQSDTFAVDFAVPQQPQIQWDTANNLLIVSGSSEYQWFEGNFPLLAGGVDTLEITETGAYYVVATDSNGCTSISDTIEVSMLTTSTLNPGEEFQLVLFPNPTRDLLYLQGLPSGMEWQAEITDAQGKRWESRLWQGQPLQVDALPSGLYFLQVRSKEGRTAVKKFMKMN